MSSRGWTSGTHRTLRSPGTVSVWSWATRRVACTGSSWRSIRSPQRSARRLTTGRTWSSRTTRCTCAGPPSCRRTTPRVRWSPVSSGRARRSSTPTPTPTSPGVGCPQPSRTSWDCGTPDPSNRPARTPGTRSRFRTHRWCHAPVAGRLRRPRGLRPARGAARAARWRGRGRDRACRGRVRRRGRPLPPRGASRGADVFLTADLRHHPASEHLEGGAPALLCASHWATEWPWLPVLARRLRGAARADGVELDVEVSTMVTEPWNTHRPTTGGHR